MPRNRMKERARGANEIEKRFVAPFSRSLSGEMRKALFEKRECKTSDCKGKTSSMSGYCRECSRKYHTERIRKQPPKVYNAPRFDTTDDVIKFYRKLK